MKPVCLTVYVTVPVMYKTQLQKIYQYLRNNMFFLNFTSDQMGVNK